MAKSVDPGWTTFERLLQAHSTRVLADLLHEEPTTVSNWKMGRSRPRFADLPRISAAVGDGDPTYLAQKMGLVPERQDSLRSLISMHSELLRLDAQVQRRQELLRQVPTDAATRIVSAALETRRWAVGVWPAFEGPEGCKLHVSDRLDFRRVDGAEPTMEALYEDLGSILSEVSALRNRVAAYPRFAALDHDEDHRLAEHWSVARLLADRPPLPLLVDAKPRSVLVISTLMQAWPSDTAAIIARILGFGLISPRALAIAVRRGLPNFTESQSLRNQFHRELLAHPPRHHVWYHFTLSTEEPSEAALSTVPPDVLILRLRETDRLLEAAWRTRGRDHIEMYQAQRLELDDALRHVRSDRLMQIDIDHPVGADGHELPSVARRNLKMERAIEAAGTFVSSMIETGNVNRDGLAAIDPKGTDQERGRVIAWLRSAKILQI